MNNTGGQMNKTTDISAESKKDVVSNFKKLIATSDLGRTSKGKGKHPHRFRRQDTVDGNPGAATKQCYPYSQGGGKTMGINGPRGGGSGTFGD